MAVSVTACWFDSKRQGHRDGNSEGKLNWMQGCMSDREFGQRVRRGREDGFGRM